MIAVTRLRVPGEAADELAASLRGVLDLLAGRPGFGRGQVGRAVDDPELLLLVTEWTGAGAYRRALGGYDVKVALADLMPYVDNEPSAYEVVDSR